MSVTQSPKVDMKLEVVVLPVTDVEAAKRFYGNLGWRLDADIILGKASRIVQFTPPGSSCAIQFGTGLTSAAPGSVQSLYLVVSDIAAAHAQLSARGVKVSEIFHRDGADAHLKGVHPQRLSYASFASFADPGGNSWLLQEITARIPGREDPGTARFSSTADLAAALRRAEAAHGQHEKLTGRIDPDWPDWYAKYLIGEQDGITQEAAR